MKAKIEEIMKTMETIEYGFKDENNQNIINVNLEKWDNDFDVFYYLQEPQELLKTKCGVCWDQVELERKLFNDNKINCLTYFIFIKDNDLLPSHTFLIFELNNSFYWFEHSWYKYKGIHKYISKEELLKDVTQKFKDDHHETNKNCTCYLYEYQKPKKHITCNSFYKYIETQKRIIL